MIAELVRRYCIVIAALVPLLLTQSQTACAEPPIEVAGDYVDTSSKPLGQHDDGAFKLVNVRATFDWTKGSVIGSSSADFAIRADEKGNGTFAGYETFTGTLNGRWGVLTFYDEGTVQGQNYRGSAVTLGGTDGLENAQMTITYEGKLGVGGTYRGTAHFTGPKL